MGKSAEVMDPPTRACRASVIDFGPPRLEAACKDQAWGLMGESLHVTKFQVTVQYSGESVALIRSSRERLGNKITKFTGPKFRMSKKTAVMMRQGISFVMSYIRKHLLYTTVACKEDHWGV